MAQNRDLTITDLSGGFNDADPPTSLAPNQCTQAENIDFWKAPVGARRNGCTAITLPTSFTTAGVDAITALHRHFPTTNETATQLWVVGLDTGQEMNLAYKDSSWHDVTLTNTPSTTLPYPYQWKFQSLHGKLFIAMKTSVDRLHVWDGTTFRPTGLLAPTVAPTSIDSGSGSFSGTRYYRTREAVVSGSTVLLRSEPSPVLTDSPSGSGSGITVTKPATINSNATHWEIEASTDNTNFYRMDRIAIATTTHTDTVSISVGYAATGTLSEDSGDYETIKSGRFLVADQDRLIIGSSFESDTYASTVWWTPVLNDPGVGNDERIPVDTDNVLNLDGYEGGGLTGLAGPINGVIYAFKWSHIYRLIRTNQRESAYEPVALSKTRGAIEGSILEAPDERGNPALYFLDPKIGPCRLGSGGLMTCGADINTTWTTVNLDATTVISRSLYFPTEKKILWWIATDASNTPDELIVLQTDASRTTDDGVRLGWTKYTGPIAQAVAACLFSTNIESNTTRNLALKPLIAVGNTVLMMESGNTDNGTSYTASLTSRPFLVSNTMNKNFGIRAASVIGDADANAVVALSLIRDFGEETSTAKDLSLAPSGSEDPVIATADNVFMSESRTVQVKLTDGTGNTSQWAIQRIDLIPRQEQSR